MGAIARESVATSLSQPVASVVIIVMVAGMCATVLLTTGRTVGAEQAVLSSIDTAGTRSIVVRSDPGAGLNTGVLDRVAHIEGIEWAAAFGPAADVTNSRIPGGTKVPFRLAWGADLEALGVPDEPPAENRTAWASDAGLELLGMPDGAGGVIDGAGIEYAVSGRIHVPTYLRFLEPLVLVPQSQVPTEPADVSVIVVIASRPDLVQPLSDAIQSVLAADDITKVRLTTSEELATLRSLIEGQLGTFGRGLMIIVFGLTGVLVAAIVFGIVTFRRKDFGRRRALGASKTLIMVLLLVQMGILASIGAVFGSFTAAVGLALGGDPLPDSAFFLAVAVLAVFIGVIAAILPAAAAAKREPLKELRVP